MKLLSKLKTEFGQKVIAALTIAAFAFAPVLQPATPVIAQEAETASVTVTKVVEGGDATVEDFDLFVGELAVESGVSVDVPVDSIYQVSETGEATADYEASFSGDCDAEGELMVRSEADGGLGSYSCTLTNTFTGEEPGDQDPLPVGLITNPSEGQTVSGSVMLEATYDDGDEENDDEVDWAVRAGTCEAGVETVFGNVDGHDDPFNWDGSMFSAEIDTTSVADGEYCFVFNPEDDEEPETDVRETVNFLIDNTPEEGGSISGMKWNDEDGDGIMDENEEGLSGWVIELISGDETSTTTTDENGEYVFAGLSEGNYSVCEEGRPAWDQTYPTETTENSVSCDEGRGLGYEIALAEDEASAGNNFGNMAETTITVNKIVINDDGGSATTTDFTLLVGDMEVESGVATPIAPDTYVVAEFGTSTVDYEASFSGDCDAEGNITIGEGEHLECTITNDDIAEGEQCVEIEAEVASDEDTMVNGTSSVAVDNDTETEGNQVPEAWTADIEGATWIWSDAQEDAAAATGTEMFTREFDWSSDATTTATLNIATDNSYVVSINGTEVASSSDEVNFTAETQDSYDVSEFIVNGTNTLEIAVTNADNGSDNPAGLLYSLSLDGFECEDEAPAPEEPSDNDGNSSGGSGGVVNRGGSSNNGGQVLGSSIDLFDGEDALCELTDDAEDLRDDIRSFLLSLEDVIDMTSDDEWNDAEDELNDLTDDIEDLEDSLQDEGFDSEADDLDDLIGDLMDAIEDEDLDDAEDIALDIADVLDDVHQELEEECVDEDNGDDDFDFDFDLDDGFVLGETFPFLPSTGAGGGSVINYLLPILLGGGIALLVLTRRKVQRAGNTRHVLGSNIFDDRG